MFFQVETECFEFLLMLVHFTIDEFEDCFEVFFADACGEEFEYLLLFDIEDREKEAPKYCGKSDNEKYDLYVHYSIVWGVW